MFDLGSFLGETFFSDDGSQNYLVLQPVLGYLEATTAGNRMHC